MPGMPQGRDIGEAGEKSVTLVTLSDDGTVQTTTRALALARFDRVEVTSTAADWPDLVAALRQAVQSARRDQTADHLVLRLRLTGSSPLAWRARRDLDLLLTEARQTAEATGSVWIESLETDLTAPRAAESGALADLDRLVAASLPPSEALAAELAELAQELSRALPSELRHLFGDDPASAAARNAALLREGAADVLARLHAPEGE
jgi:DNA repair protein SbcD/Mre11